MCGLVGCAGRIENAHEKAFKLLLQLDTIRGKDSTGVASVSNQNVLTVAKEVGTPWEFENSKRASSVYHGMLRVLIGHNRAATKGAVNRLNAHPFEFDTLVGAHNGTLRNWSKLRGWRDFDVDSEALYDHMNSLGLDSTLKSMEGAYALTWFNKEHKSLNFLRNHERTLFYCFTEDSKAMFWASEEWMLTVALHKSNVKHGKIQKFEEMKHYYIDLELGATFGNDVLGKMHIRDKASVLPKVVTYNQKKQAGLPKCTAAGGAGNAKKKASAASRAAYEWFGEDVYFFLKEYCEEGGSSHFVGHTEDHGDVPVKVYIGDANLCSIYKQNLGSLYHGKVRRLTIPSKNEEPYLLLDPRSIVHVDCATESSEEKKYLPGFQGEPLTKSEWKEKTSKDCAWCTSPAIESEAGELFWFAHDEFVCGTCKSVKEVKDYMLGV